MTTLEKLWCIDVVAMVHAAREQYSWHN